MPALRRVDTASKELQKSYGHSHTTGRALVTRAKRSRRIIRAALVLQLWCRHRPRHSNGDLDASYTGTAGQPLHKGVISDNMSTKLHLHGKGKSSISKIIDNEKGRMLSPRWDGITKYWTRHVWPRLGMISILGMCVTTHLHHPHSIMPATTTRTTLLPRGLAP